MNFSFFEFGDKMIFLWGGNDGLSSGIISSSTDVKKSSRGRPLESSLQQIYGSI